MAKSSTETKAVVKDKPTVYSVLQSFLVLLFVGITCLGVVALTAVRWTESQVLTTENWVTYITPLPKNPEVSEALSTFVVSKVFDSGDVQNRVTEVLPPRAEFLAPPLTNQLENITKNTTTNVIQSDAFQNIWVTANRTAHQRMLERARNEPTSENNQRFQLDLSNMGPVLREGLGRVAEALPERPSGDIVINADLQARSQRLHQYIRTVDFLQAVLPFLLVASGLGALAFARDRRRVLLAGSVLVFVLSLLQLIGVKALRPAILGAIQNSTYRPAVGELYDSFVASFNSSVTAVLILAIVVWLVMILAGAGTLGIYTRRFIRLNQFQQTSPYELWRKLRLWIADNRHYLWATIAVLTLLYGAFILEFSWQTAFTTTCVTLASLALVQILASPPYLTRT